MATPVLNSDVAPFKLDPFAASYYGRLSELPPGEKPEFGTVSVAAGISGAKGAMMALGIEMAAVVVALCVYGVSRL